MFMLMKRFELQTLLMTVDIISHLVLQAERYLSKQRQQKLRQNG